MTYAVSRCSLPGNRARGKVKRATLTVRRDPGARYNAAQVESHGCGEEDVVVSALTGHQIQDRAFQAGAAKREAPVRALSQPKK